MVVTTISCDAVILRCSSCQAEFASTEEIAACLTCGTAMSVEGRCDRSFALRKDSLLIRCIAENKDRWRCEDRGGRDLCPDHADLSNSVHVARTTPPVIEGAPATT